MALSSSQELSWVNEYPDALICFRSIAGRRLVTLWWSEGEGALSSLSRHSLYRKMSRCKTDCLEKPLSSGFRWFGRFVGSHPWWFLILPLFLSGGLGAGFIFLRDRQANGIEDQFTPVNGLAKRERAFVQDNFQNTGDFSQLRLSTEGTYGSLIITALQNILTDDALTEIINLDKQVKRLNTENPFASLCARNDGTCMSNPVLDIINYTASKISDITLEYPEHKGVFLGSVLGGVQLKEGSSKVNSAKAMRLFYFLKEENLNETVQWLKAFIHFFSNYTGLNTVSVSYFTSLSREEEFESSSASVIPFFSITYFLAITISIISCLRLDCVRNKVWVASFGVLSAGLAVLSSFGLLLFCGMPFAMTVASAPFLILGIGVDDMFIMISCWQKTKVKDQVEERLAETYKEAAVSITITTLTDVLAFYIGLMTPFRSVQSFCMYTGTAVLFCYIYNITFFGAFLALNGRREQGNRHWLTCMVVPEEKDNPDGNICYVGGAYDKETGTEKEMPIHLFFKKYYGPFLTHSCTKVFMIILYCGYLAASIYGCLQIQEGIELKNLAVDSSYVVEYYDKEKKYFSEYGPNVMIVIKDDEFQYWNTSARESLDLCLQEFNNLSMTSKDLLISWLQSYMLYGKDTLDLNDENIFKTSLPGFLQVSRFSQDVNFTDNQILASRMFVQTVNISRAIDEKNMLNAFRETAENCQAVDLLVYHYAFIYFDQYAVIVSNTIQNVVVATLAMLVISLLLIPNPICSLWVTFAIASVIVGVAGFMALWDVNLDSISMINLVICIGFSVDFSAHISYAFVSSNEPSGNKKAIDALYNLGYPMIQAAVSTIAGVVVLAASQSYIFRTFFKIMFLVILFGLVHGVVFIPVFLSLLGFCGKAHNSIEHENTTKQHNNMKDQSVFAYSNSGFASQKELKMDPYAHEFSNVYNLSPRASSKQRAVPDQSLIFSNSLPWKNADPDCP
ncbi:patched domain-containing protein 3-like [Colossoma macropomum]|uniref:patched domain-containing protein 3-like n=1 Tax=Colossoma macropomum TaxID=42526 RepID=UPI001865230C|nr:patched domain-containing protein 3-like [Colossoma macropomum]